MKTIRNLTTAVIASIIALGCAHTGTSATAPAAPVQPSTSNEKFEQDRKSILSMAGEYSVNFDFHETLRFDPSAAVSEPEDTDAKELVVLVEDKGNFISLQHLLMVGPKDVVKHWRQDWRYEDNVIHEFKGHLTWEPRTLTPEETKGTWTQTVYQVDDSPRYEGVGKWVHIADYSYWDSNETWRPLPRREYTKRDDYDVLVGRNRHAITKNGWTHEQDNYKLRLRDGKKEVLARETGVNTYEHSKDYDFAAAKEYWQKTGPFWSDVRKAWDAQYATMKTFHLIGDDNKDSLWRLIYAEADEYAKSGKSPDGGVAKTIEARLRPGLREN